MQYLERAKEAREGEYYEAAALALAAALKEQKEAVATAEEETGVKGEASRRAAEERATLARENRRWYFVGLLQMVAEEYEEAVEALKNYLELARPPEVLRWKFDTEGPANGISPVWRLVESAQPTVVDGVAYVGSLGQGVSALEVATGQRRWHFKTEEAVLRPPLVVDGGVYVASDSEYVYALDAATGELRWEFEATAKVADDLAVADGVVYVCTRDDELLALDALTGQVRWKFEAETGQLGRPLIAGELIYLRWSSAMGERASSCLYALEALAGEAREPALAWLSSLAEWAGEDYDAHWEVGRGFCRLEAYDQARREGERLRQLQPDNPEAPWFLSRVEFAARNWAASEALLRRVLQDRPRLWQAHYYLVRALLAQLREEYPQLAPVLNFSALEQELAGLPAAREAYQIFLQAEPEGAWADRARERLAALEAKEAKVP